MGYDILEAMEFKNVNTYNDYYSNCVGEHGMDDDTYSLSDSLEQNNRDKNIYKYINQTMAQNIL